jgi:hypothetical protein
MRNDMAQAFLMAVLESTEAITLADNRNYFQNMAKYKYDQYQQFAPGMRFIERFALWLNQFDSNDRKSIFNFIRNRLVFISNEEMNNLVSASFPDLIRKILVDKVAQKQGIPEYLVSKVIASNEYKIALKQSLFFGLSDGARTDVFRRANSGIVSHEQVYQTYELSDEQAKKVHGEFLPKELEKICGKGYDSDLSNFQNIFLLDDFSASGTSYLREKEGQLKGKISQLYKSIFEAKEKIYDTNNLKVCVILYLCTNQAYGQITGLFDNLAKVYGHKPSLHCMHIIPDSFKLDQQTEKEIYDLCMNPKYYDAAIIEDEHTGPNIQLGYKSCALPLILAHNCPNNSLSMLWSYEHSEKFAGLFPRIPRHRVL